MDKFISVTQATRKHRMPVQVIDQLVKLGTIRVALISGKLYVSEVDLVNQAPKELRPEYTKYLHLKGIPISYGDAERRYEINHGTIARWVKKGFVSVIGADKNRVLLDEADVAYCAEVRSSRSGQGKWLFRSDGTPYKPAK